MPLTWSLTKPTHNSTNAWCFEGTPDVALRVASHRKPSPITPRISDMTIVSTLTDQKSPSPTDLVKNER